MSAPASRPLLAYSFARQHGVIAVPGEGGTVTLAHRPSASRDALIEARRVVGHPVARETLTPEAFEQTLSGLYAQADLSSASEDALGAPQDLSALADGLPRTSDLLDSSDDAPIIRLINGVLQEAIRSRASDIHIEPYEERLAVRFRIDGTLSEALSLPARLAPALTSRVKVMSRLDIAQKRIPQDGRFSLNLGERAIDLRVSTLPSRHGERVVMRILEKDNQRMALEELGMDPAVQDTFANALARPNGIILVTGPTGSGKTTSLYAALSRLNDGSRNILTVEDPVEYALDGIGQTQVNNAVGMSFAAGLRAILRQDPDVVMVGEIRDPETAEIAVQASLTGHLVLSTVHTNSAIASVARLRDMGVEPFLLSSTLTALIAQRLVRRLCDDCKAPYDPSAAELAELGLTGRGVTMYKPVGCSHCSGVGYRGRLGIYEIVPMDETLRAMIHEGATESEMAKQAFAARQTLLADGADKVLAGLTSSDEVLRVCRTDEA
ncbi:type II secretion system ATPase GspE [Algimonas porphyrae]|uniref:type II secretion system ATPase GspE n=1 Tax=Algimonas porphyrae TaxID=1128113 RepID=UPI0024E0F522|nr:type II secretion system ATPase GspE [Algimonas porphyrae]